MAEQKLAQSVACQHPPVGSCGNTTHDPSMLCHHHRDIVARGKDALEGFSPTVLTVDISTMDASNYQDGVTEDDMQLSMKEDDVLPPMVKFRGSRDETMEAVAEYLNEDELDRVEESRDGVKIPASYYARRRRELSGNTSDEIEGATTTKAEEPREIDGPTSTEGTGEAPESTPRFGDREFPEGVRPYRPYAPTMDARLGALNHLPQKDHAALNDMMENWDHVMSQEGNRDIADRWNSLSEKDQADIIKARLKEYQKASKQQRKAMKRQSKTYLTRQIMKRADNRIGASSRALWNAPYDASGWVIGGIGKMLRRIFR